MNFRILEDVLIFIIGTIFGALVLFALAIPLMYVYHVFIGGDEMLRLIDILKNVFIVGTISMGVVYLLLVLVVHVLDR